MSQIGTPETITIRAAADVSLRRGTDVQIPVNFTPCSLPTGQKISFKVTLGRLKIPSQTLVLDVDSSSVLVKNCNLRPIVKSKHKRLGYFERNHDSSPRAISMVRPEALKVPPKITVALPVLSKSGGRPSKAIPIVRSPSVETEKQKQPELQKPDTGSSAASISLEDRSPSSNGISIRLPPPLLAPSTKPDTTPSAFANYDVYAQPYIPDTLRNINILPARQICTPSLQRIDFDKFVSSFAGNSFLSNEQPKALTQQIAQHSSINHESHLFPDLLIAKDYGSYWTSALTVEIAAQQQMYDHLALWEVPLSFSQRTGTLPLSVPGLAEGNLQVEPGDRVFLRQLRLLPQAHTSGLSKLGFTGVENVAIIVHVDRRQELLELRAVGIVHGSMRFNVRFDGQLRKRQAVELAVADAVETLALQQHISNDSLSKLWLNSMLFPESHDGIMQHRLNPATLSFSPIDKTLNLEQLRAIDSIVRKNYGTLPFLIDGPPGTGKTKTLVEAILQLLPNQQNHVLVCAPSDPAADILALRLAAHLGPHELLRLNDEVRTFAEVPERLLIICCIDDDHFSLPAFSNLMRCRVVVTSCKDAALLVRARLTNTDLANLEHGLLATLHPDINQLPLKLHWTALFLDEAAQAAEPEALIPLSVVRPPSTISCQDQPTFVMAGDPRQLNPRTTSKSIAMETSLFARLLEREVYHEHPLARSNLVDRPQLTQNMLPMYRPPFATLIRNYRSHPAILAVPSALFYSDTLVPEAADSKALMMNSIWRGRGWPVLFCQNDGLDEIEGDGGGWYNLQEAHRAMLCAQTLLHGGGILEQDICIISAFQAQVRVLRKLARSPQYNLWHVNIGPLEAFQGLESRAVILCTTRARDRFLEQDIANGFGVIKEAKRFNIALTRARQALIVIGNARVLAIDSNWRTFLSFCWRHGLWNGDDNENDTGGPDQPWVTAEDDIPMHVSRLESALVYAEDRVEVDEGGISKEFQGLRFGGMDETDAMYASALAAENTLRDE